MVLVRRAGESESQISVAAKFGFKGAKICSDEKICGWLTACENE